MRFRTLLDSPNYITFFLVACVCLTQKTAAASPYAYTATAIMVSETNAVLNGMVTPNRLSSVAWFEWGANSCTNQTEPVWVGDQGGIVNITNRITRLIPGVDYRFRLVASNSCGIAYGAERLFAFGKRVLIWDNNPDTSAIIPRGLSNAVAIAAGSQHGLALRSDGTVLGWGANQFGQISVPSGLREILMIAAGGAHSLALKTDGKVEAWGDSRCSQINVPSELSQVFAIAGGGDHSLAVRMDGAVVAWGREDYGQTRVPSEATNVVEVSAGQFHSLALKSDGTVIAWGYNGYGQSSVPDDLTNVVRIAAGAYHSLALRRDGAVVAWGRNDNGQCRVPADLSNVIAISAAGINSLALRNDGTVKAWGEYFNGIEYRPMTSPAESIGAVEIAGGNMALAANHAPICISESVSGGANCDLTIWLSAKDPDEDQLSWRIVSLPETGALYQFQEGGRGEAIVSEHTLVSDAFGRVIFAPLPNTHGSNYSTFRFDVTDGAASSPWAETTVNINAAPLASTLDAIITGEPVVLRGMASSGGYTASAWFEWGKTSAYEYRSDPIQIGNAGSIIYVTNAVPGINVKAICHYRLVVSNEVGITYGENRVFASGSKVWSWGSNDLKQNTGATGLSNIVAIAEGRRHSLALKSDGTVVAWGDNSARQTNGAANLRGIVAIAAGGYHNLALGRQGQVFAWGSNGYGQTTVPPNLTAIAIAAGENHSLALRDDGTVVAWGLNSSGQSIVPAEAEKIVAISGGGEHSLALRIDGSVFAWGDNAYGQVKAPAFSEQIVSVAAGFQHSMALGISGRVVAWGRDNYGQTQIPAWITNAVAIASGYWHAMVIKKGGTVAFWGHNADGQTNVPFTAYENILAVAGGAYHSLALAGDRRPVAESLKIVGPANKDLVIRLRGTDPNGDPVSFKVLNVPDRGRLFQCKAGARDAMIIKGDTWVADPDGRVVFSPETNSYGCAYAGFDYLASDGVGESAPAPVVIHLDGVPTATTHPATLITLTDALLNGMVMPNGCPSIAWFEWGTNLEYLNRTDYVHAGDGGTVTLVTNRITTLEEGVVHHFRAAISNRFGIAYGADRMFSIGLAARAYGDNYWGQTNVPAGLTNVIGILAGSRHSHALMANGRVHVWGKASAVFSNVVSMSSSSEHFTALKADGKVSAWSYAGVADTSVPAGLENIVSIAESDYSYLALKRDGTVSVWGSASASQTNFVSGLANMVSIRPFLALKHNSTVVAWGSNNYGETNVPAGLTNVVAIARGAEHCLALRANGTVVAWGRNNYGQTNVPVGLSNVVEISAGSAHSLALQKDGTLVAWGKNQYGTTNTPPLLTNVVAISAGTDHNLVLSINRQPVVTSSSARCLANSDVVIPLLGADADGDRLYFRITSLPGAGSLYQFDANTGIRGALISSEGTVVADSFGRVIYCPSSNLVGMACALFKFDANDGYNDSSSATVSIDIGVPSASTFPATIRAENTAVLNGMAHPSGVPSTAWFEWGRTRSYGNRTEMVDAGGGSAVAFLTNKITDLITGETYHFRMAASNSFGVSYGIDRVFALGKKVRAWGRNDFGQTNVPPGLSNIVAIAAGGYHSLGLKTDGTVIGWGRKIDGQINVPPGLTNVVAIAAGDFHSMVLKADRTVVAFGRNYDGQAKVPSSLSNVVAIAAGGEHNVVLRSDGTVLAWGANDYGQTNVPMGLNNVVAIDAGMFHSIALRNDGAVITWGYKCTGQLKPPVTLVDGVAVAAGAEHCFALTRNGTVTAWGGNLNGQLNIPGGLYAVADVAAGYYHGLALSDTGSVSAWGANSSGQTDVPSDLFGAISISAKAYHNLALVSNRPPAVRSQIVFGSPDRDVVIWLSGSDADGDTISYKITRLPQAGKLYQFEDGARGAEISANDTLVADSFGRVIFAADSTDAGLSRFGLEYLANDGQVESGSGMVTINILAISISNPGFNSDKFSFQLTVEGLSNGTFSTWASTNCTDWINIGPAVQTRSNLFEFNDPEAANHKMRFYQLRWP